MKEASVDGTEVFIVEVVVPDVDLVGDVVVAVVAVVVGAVDGKDSDSIKGIMVSLR